MCVIRCWFQDYTQNIHGKEIDLLRVTVKVPGKRPPRAVAPVGPSPAAPSSAPGVNGLSKEPTAPDNTSTGMSHVHVYTALTLSVGGQQMFYLKDKTGIILFWQTTHSVDQNQQCASASLNAV